MKVKDLIKKLNTFDGELEITFTDYESDSFLSIRGVRKVKVYGSLNKTEWAYGKAKRKNKYNKDHETKVIVNLSIK